MKKAITIAIGLAAAGTASAGGKEGTIGLGVEAEISGLAGLSLNYDAGAFHVGGFVGYERPGGANATTEVGARFFWHLHKTAMADFSVGANVGVASVPRMGALPGLGVLGSTGAITCNGGVNPPSHCTAVYLEPAFQIRMFVASNVALSFTGGVVIGVADADEVAFGGQVTALAGVHYYFF